MFLRPWLYLLASVTVEIIGVTAMKFVSDSGSLPSMFFMYTMIGLSFYFFATTVKYLPIALAYAAWETIGLVSITVIGYFVFAEGLGLYKIVGLAALGVGVTLVSIGSPE